MRKLASIRQISEVLPIENADAIEKVHVDGWWCVAKKGEFKSSDLCVYFEIDSLLPMVPQFEFLRKNGTKKMLLEDGKEVEGFRLRTVKLRGQVSQGLALPLSMFILDGVVLGDDVTEKLGVYKYEMGWAASVGGDAKGFFPSFIPKTDEERAQNLKSELREQAESLEKLGVNLEGNEFSVRVWATEKLDGSSVTFFKYNGEFGVCSRNLELKETEGDAIWKMANKYELKEKLADGFAIQAELVGPGIQGNPLKLKDVDVYAFYVYNIMKSDYVSFSTAREIVESLGMKNVPLIGTVDFTLDTDFYVNYANGRMSMLSPSCLAEGVVFRVDGPTKFSFKASSNKYLLRIS